MRIIALANQKGGCGKTTVATNLAAALARLDKRVLLIDNDPQGHATLACGFTERDFSLSTYDLYMTTDILVEDAFVEARGGLHLVPAGIELSAVEQTLAREPEKEMRLRKTLQRSALPYDVVLIDCPPSVGLLTFNALLASGEVVVPVDASTQSLQAARKFRETLAVLRERRGHDLVPHLLLSNFDPRPRFARLIAAEVGERHGEALLETVVHPTVRLKEAAAAGQPVVDYDPGSRASLDFRLLAEELLARQAALGVPDLDRWRELLEGPQLTAEGVRFVGRFPRAESVRLTGSFTAWSAEGIPLTQREDGLWETLVPLPAGRHEYRLVVDGEWREDPSNPEAVGNEFGGHNSLVVVP